MTAEDGHWVYILDRGRIAARDEEGRPARFTGTHLDVTATELAKRVLEDQERTLRHFVRILPAAVGMFDRDRRGAPATATWTPRGHPSGRILRSPPPRRGLGGSTMKVLLVDDDAALVREVVIVITRPRKDRMAA